MTKTTREPTHDRQLLLYTLEALGSLFGLTIIGQPDLYAGPWIVKATDLHWYKYNPDGQIHDQIETISGLVARIQTCVLAALANSFMVSYHSAEEHAAMMELTDTDAINIRDAQHITLNMGEPRGPRPWRW